MAADEEDARALAVQIQELSRRVGRVLVTSRRREQIEARPIEIKPLSSEESVAFLKSRGEDLNRLRVAEASPKTLCQYAEKLGNKPLVLEVFLQALGEQGISLERAFDRVARMQHQDLGQFLYADAWGRLSNRVKHVMLLMTRIMDIHDEISFKLCCSQCKVALEEASNAIEESRGIASISRLNGQLQITFKPEFIMFCKDRLASPARRWAQTSVARKCRNCQA